MFTVLPFLIAAAASANPDSVARVKVDGVEVVAKLSNVAGGKEDQRPHVEIVLQREGKAGQPLKLDFARSKYPEFAEVLGPSFDWGLLGSLVDLGPKRVARIGLWGRTGEDLMVVQEIAILVGIDEQPKVVWVGLGDRQENQFDVCLTSTLVSFRMPQPGTIERKSRSTKKVDRRSKGDDMDEYRKRCKAPAAKRDTFRVDAG